jgi:hypothetical protein
VATVRCWQPATADVKNIQRVAVVNFRGEHGPEVAAELADRLWSNRFYAMVDQSELTTIQHAAYSPDPCDQTLLTQARERGIDALVFGEVHTYRFNAAPPSGEPVTAGDPTADSSGEVSVTFRLVDTLSGATRVEETATHRFDGAAIAGGAAAPAASDVLGRLTEMCLDDCLALLTPHQSQRSMVLADARWFTRESAAVRQGNRLAAEGNWDAARDQWQAAIDRRPSNDAALFNLAVDAAHRQQYRQAEEFAMRALRIRHTDQYANGLAQIREYRSTYDEVARQRERHLLQARR